MRASSTLRAPRASCKRKRPDIQQVRVSRLLEDVPAVDQDGDGVGSAQSRRDEARLAPWDQVVGRGGGVGGARGGVTSVWHAAAAVGCRTVGRAVAVDGRRDGRREVSDPHGLHRVDPKKLEVDWDGRRE